MMPTSELPPVARAASAWLRALTSEPDPATAWELTSQALRADLVAAWLTEARVVDPTVPALSLEVAGGHPPFAYALVHLLTGLTDMLDITRWEQGWATAPRLIGVDLEVALLTDMRQPAVARVNEERGVANAHPFVMRHDVDRGWMVTALPTILPGVGEHIDITSVRHPQDP